MLFLADTRRFRKPIIQFYNSSRGSSRRNTCTRRKSNSLFVRIRRTREFGRNRFFSRPSSSENVALSNTIQSRFQTKAARRTDSVANSFLNGTPSLSISTFFLLRQRSWNGREILLEECRQLPVLTCEFFLIFYHISNSDSLFAP